MLTKQQLFRPNDSKSTNKSITNPEVSVLVAISTIEIDWNGIAISGDGLELLKVLIQKNPAFRYWTILKDSKWFK